MAILVDDPHAFVRDIAYLDCRLIAIRLDDAGAWVEFVIAGTEPAGTRFFRLHFAGVSNLRRDNTLYRTGFRGFDPAILSVQPGSLGAGEAVEIHLTKSDDGYALRVPFGSLGEYRFTFTQLAVERRTGHAHAAGDNTWEYTDRETGARIDFNDPFPA
ncbi:MAG: hypothetical protein BWY76_01141 [bacterium ADurb.Bin429]|nr:MAG: hypothetical protein BWY76_01141 [bacterium ADurb.Bin429]